jgi:hypothetical protein
MDCNGLGAFIYLIVLVITDKESIDYRDSQGLTAPRITSDPIIYYSHLSESYVKGDLLSLEACRFFIPGKYFTSYSTCRV